MELIIIIIDSKFNSNPTKHILDKIYITIIYIVPTKAPLTIPFLFIFIELNELPTKILIILIINIKNFLNNI